MRFPAALALLLALAGAPVTGAAGAAIPTTFPSAAVAADHALASEAGVEVLKAGGNAVDAAVATSFALSVVRPYSCGVGGGGFMVIRFRAHPTHGDLAVALNYRETGPAAITADYYLRHADPEASSRGGPAVGVPGTVAGLLHAHDRYGSGRLDRRAVLAPAIRLAEEGFLVDRHYFDNTRKLDRSFREDPARQRRFAFVYERFLASGRLQVGDRIRLPEQARLLRLLAERGPAAFYEGEVAAAIERAVAADQGLLTAADLKGYRVATAQPLRFKAFGRELLTMPPPSSGGVAMAQVLGLLERTGYRPAAGDAASLHLLAESFKHAFADRARYLGDPAFVDVPVDRLLSGEYLDARARKIDRATTRPVEQYGTLPSPPDDAGTSHFCVVDGRGDAVSCTETINTIFGSLVAVPEYGFILNNELDDFTARPGKPNAFGLIQSPRNAPAPGKRPLSSMTPTIVLDADGRVEALAGGSGGPRIITGTMQVLLNVLLRGDDAPTAAARPRLHHQWLPDRLEAEAELLPADVAAGLRRLGHGLDEPSDGVGNVQVIRRTPQGWSAASDPRKGGRPAGY